MNQYQKIKSKINELKSLGKDTFMWTSLSTWCVNQITWAWKFRKITSQERDELCEEMIMLFEGNY